MYICIYIFPSVKQKGIFEAQSVSQMICPLLPDLEVVTDNRNIVFLIKPQLRYMDVIAKCIKK